VLNFTGGALEVWALHPNHAPDVTISCPKCASSEGKSIEAIYCECRTPQNAQRAITAELSRQSAPPGRRHPAWWMIIAAMFLIAAGFSGIARDSTTLALLTCAALSALMAHDADKYNELDLPRLLEYWHRAFMCERCGEVFVPG